MSVVTRQVCETCGEAFVPERNRVGRFCSRACRNEANRYTVLPAKDTRRGEAAAILKSETKGRVKPMTMDEFELALARERRLLLDAGEPLFRLDMGGAAEKKARIAAHDARMHAVVTATARKGER
jgi:hypothetical protein